jgi:hypothetical protein
MLWAAFLAGPLQAQVPGDRSKLVAPHPGYTLATLMPQGLQPGVSGMDFLSDGRLVLCTWGGNHLALTPPSRKGEIYIVSNVDADDVAKVTYTRFATGLQEPLGLKVVNDTVYISERQALAALYDKNKNGALDSGEYRKVAAYASGAERHEFFFGLLYKDGWFYGAHSLSLIAGGPAAVPQPNANRGTYLRVDKNTGRTEYLSGGAREPFGWVMNPEGEMFSTDVQGTWNPFSSFTQVRPGRFYGHPQIDQSPPSPYDKLPYNPPAVMLPQSELANAPGQPVYVKDGIFQGQYLYGDVTYGGIQRIFLEKAAGEYQGCALRFSAGFIGGVGRLIWAPNGDLIVGEVGDPDGNWHEPGKKPYGLQRLRPNGKTVFEMLSVRSRPKGMEIEFTQPAAADADQAVHYEVDTWKYQRTASYGGSPIDKHKLTVDTVKVDAARKKVYLAIKGLQTGYLVHVRLNGLKSATGAAPWSTEAWYTLNALGTGNAFDPPVTTAPRLTRDALKVYRAGDRIVFGVAAEEAYVLKVFDARGALEREFHGKGAGRQSLSIQGLARGAHEVLLETPSGRVSRLIPNY